MHHKEGVLSMGQILVILAFIFSGMSVVEAKATTKKSSKKSKYEKLDTEVVKSSPLSKPYSARLRQKRQQMEMETEEQIVQKLEDARMADERRRREQLFNRDLNVVEQNLEPAPAPAPAPAPVAQTNEITTTVVVSEPEEDNIPLYVTIGGGSVSYPVVNNLPNANGAAGFGLGLGLGNDFWLEGGFLYSYQEAEIISLSETRTEDIDHYTFSAAGKYTFGMSSHWVNPVAGVSLNYTRREFNGGNNSSNAFDAGLIGGVDLALNKAVKLGFEGRYMFNIDYNRDSAVDAAEVLSQQVATGRDVKNIEENDYIVLLLNAKVLF